MSHRLICQGQILLSSINWVVVVQKDFLPFLTTEVLFFIRKLVVAVQQHGLSTGRVLFEISEISSDELNSSLSRISNVEINTFVYQQRDVSSLLSSTKNKTMDLN